MARKTKKEVQEELLRNRELLRQFLLDQIPSIDGLHQIMLSRNSPFQWVAWLDDTDIYSPAAAALYSIEESAIIPNKKQLAVKLIQTKDDELVTPALARESGISLEKCVGAFDIPVQKPIYVETREDAAKYASSPDWEVIYRNLQRQI